MRKTLSTILLFAAGSFSFSQSLAAAVVTSNADNGAGSLRAAIANAAAGETIEFAISGVIGLTSGELLIDKDLVIRGPGASNLLIQRVSAPDGFRIFNLNGGVVQISGLSIGNGLAAEGGGINNETTTVISDCVVLNNSATNSGGGIHNLSSLTLSNCVVQGNRVVGSVAEGRGGGINNDGSLTNLSCLILSNSVSAGAGAFGGGINNAGHLELTNNVISGNSALAGAGAEAAGGGIFNQGTLFIHTTTLANNWASGGSGVVPGPAEGGGLANESGSVTFDRSTVSGNLAVGGSSTGPAGGVAQGGGIANSLATMVIESSTVSGNSVQGGSGASAVGAAQGGGLFNINFGSVALAHSTVTANQGEGVFNADGVIEIKNTILVANAGALDLFSTLPADIQSGGFNLLGSWTVAIIPGLNDLTNVSPAAARLGLLQNNGGPTATHALLCGSPAINAGDNTAAPATDQRGFARIVNGTMDIGAYELNDAVPAIVCPPATTVCGSSSNVTTTVAVTVSDLDPDPLRVIWTVDGVVIQTNLVPAGNPSTTGRVELVVQLLPGNHTVTATVVDANECSASCSTLVTTATRGDLYPIALHQANVSGLAVGAIITDIYNGSQPGNFGWLTWAGSPNEPTLATSLTPPGNSQTYINPLNPNDHVVSVGDWVRGKPGVTNSDKVRGALEKLKQIDITVPVWDKAIKRGSNTQYHIVAFARVRILDYRLPQQNRITARFLGLLPCD